jgi:hypothetical protein
MNASESLSTWRPLILLVQKTMIFMIQFCLFSSRTWVAESESFLEQSDSTGNDNGFHGHGTSANCTTTTNELESFYRLSSGKNPVILAAARWLASQEPCKGGVPL